MIRSILFWYDQPSMDTRLTKCRPLAMGWKTAGIWTTMTPIKIILEVEIMTFTRVHHVGMITADLEAARHVFCDGFGLAVDEHRTP